MSPNHPHLICKRATASLSPFALQQKPAESSLWYLPLSWTSGPRAPTPPPGSAPNWVPPPLYHLLLALAQLGSLIIIKSPYHYQQGASCQLTGQAELGLPQRAGQPVTPPRTNHPTARTVQREDERHRITRDRRPSPQLAPDRRVLGSPGRESRLVWESQKPA